MPGLLLIFPCHSLIGNLDTFLYLVTVGRPSQTTSGVMSLDYNVGGGHPNLVCLSSLFHPILMYIFFPLFAAKTRPKLESKYKGRVKDASDYTKTIDDFDELINPRTLARYFLGPEPSPYVLRAIANEEKSEFLVLAYLFLR